MPTSIKQAHLYTCAITPRDYFLLAKNLYVFSKNSSYTATHFLKTNCQSAHILVSIISEFARANQYTIVVYRSTARIPDRGMWITFEIPQFGKALASLLSW